MIRNIKKTRKKLSTGIIFYLISSISVYFWCELLKAANIIKVESYYFKNCIYAFKNDCMINLSNNTIYTICGVLNYKENYTKFITNLLYTLLIIYTLSYKLSFELVNFKYWIVVHASTLGYSLLDYSPIFTFSLVSDCTYDLKQILIIVITSTILFALIVRQAFREKRLRYYFLTSIIIIYLFLFLLFKSVTEDVQLHFHHAFCAGLLSICFTDFSSTINFYMHAILTGIIIQGINVYTIDEIFLFNVPYIASPTFEYMVWICSTYFTIWIMLILDIPMVYNTCSKLKNCCRKKEENLYEMLLVPTTEEMTINY